MNRPVLKMTLFALSCFALSVELVIHLFRATWKQVATTARKRRQIRLEQSVTRVGYAEPRVRVSATNTETEEQPVPAEWFGDEAGLLRLRNHW
jgi:hypothetical protein